MEPNPSVHTLLIQSLAEWFEHISDGGDTVQLVLLNPAEYELFLETDHCDYDEGEDETRLWDAVVRPAESIRRGHCLLFPGDIIDAADGPLSSHYRRAVFGIHAV